MLTTLFYIFLAYLLYLFVFRLVIPVWRTTRQVKRSFREMQERMNTAMGGHPDGHAPVAGRPADRGPAPAGDYIDFEEVKE